jgi:hypothetical protein
MLFVGGGDFAGSRAGMEWTVGGVMARINMEVKEKESVVDD